MIGMSNVISTTRSDNIYGFQKSNRSSTVASDFISKTESVSQTDKPQTLEEFKKEIYGVINSMSVHPSQSNTQISVSISDKAFEKMMNDGEYKKEMLRVIQRDLGGAYPSGVAPSYSSIRIGDDCEYRADAMGSAYGDTFSAHSSNSFWEKNTSKASSSYDDYEKRKKQYNMKQEEIAYQQKSDARQLAEKYRTEREFQEKLDSDRLYKKVLEQYEQNTVYAD